MSSQAIQPNRKLNFWELWNMSFGFFGIQFGFELQNSNVSRIFETLGANKDEIPILWIAAPLTGLLVQPIIGYLSDRTWHPYWGRRRPFFFIGAILATIALFIMPNSSALWMAGGMLWVLDASINISMEPFRAFVGDKLAPTQRTAGFAMQSFFIGIGSVIAALLPWIFTNWFHVSNTAAAGHIPPSVKWSFYLGGFAFLGSVMYTVFTTKEFPPENMEAFKAEKKNTTFIDGVKETFGGILKMPTTMKQLAFVQFFTCFALFSMWIYATNAVTANKYNMKVEKALVDKMETAIGADILSNTDIKKQKTLTSLKGDIDEIRKYRGDRPAVRDQETGHASRPPFSGRQPGVPDDARPQGRVHLGYRAGGDGLSPAGVPLPPFLDAGDQLPPSEKHRFSARDVRGGVLLAGGGSRGGRGSGAVLLVPAIPCERDHEGGIDDVGGQYAAAASDQPAVVNRRALLYGGGDHGAWGDGLHQR